MLTVIPSVVLKSSILLLVCYIHVFIRWLLTCKVNLARFEVFFLEGNLIYCCFRISRDTSMCMCILPYQSNNPPEPNTAHTNR